MAIHKTERNMTPVMNVPVTSTRIPMIKGPVNPPISATQKNIPPADPIYLVPTSGLSIRMSSIKGMKEELKKPRSTNPVIRKTPETFTVIKRITAVIDAKSAINRPLKAGGASLGTSIKAGIPVAMGIDEAKPALAAEKPPFSRILGSQLPNP